MGFDIIHLPKEHWEGYQLPMDYTSNDYMDVAINPVEGGFDVSFRMATSEETIVKKKAPIAMENCLYAPFVPDACAWGVVKDGRLVAAIETGSETRSNRLRIWEIWIDEKYRNMGIGHALLEVAKEQARLESRRAVVLGFRSSNMNALGFYLHEGFTLCGFDSCRYRNDDLKKKNVRIEMAYFLRKAKKVTRDEIEIREERLEEYHEVERMVQEAFWNKYMPGCDEHLLVHKMRKSEAYLPHYSRVAVKDGEIIGMIMYGEAAVEDAFGVKHSVATFGPLCVKAEWQGCGVGEILLTETMEMVRKDGKYPGVIILGEPTYYPRLGFKTTDNFMITMEDGSFSEALMGYELKPHALEMLPGRMVWPEIYSELSAEETELFNRSFKTLPKMYFPKQWKKAK